MRTPTGRLRLLASAAVSAAVTLASTLTASTPAGADQATACLLAHPGPKIPVLLVHGFESTAGTWGGNDATGDLARLNATGHMAAAAFAYGDNTGNAAGDKALSDQWVTNPGIGHDLAQQIACAAAASRTQGGPGKVVLVGHSMGGLAIRCALNAACNDGGSGSVGDLAADVADVITFGTPNGGSFLRGGTGRSSAESAAAITLTTACYGMVSSDSTIVPRPPAAVPLCDLIDAFGASPASVAFTENSPQLRALPGYPANVPVLAVAGRVAVTTSVGTLWHRTLAGSAGDLVVSATSALATHQPNGVLGGTDTEDCGTLDLSASAGALTIGVSGPVGVAGAALFLKNALAGLTCLHTDETHNDGFLAQILGQINHMSRGLWSDRTLTITGTSLGAVTAGMTLPQARAAAGLDIQPSGDGEYGVGTGSLATMHGGPGPGPGFRCFGVSWYDPSPPSQQVRTPDGFMLLQTVDDLKHVYGSRLHYSAGRFQQGGLGGPGIYGDGYWVSDNGGYLGFQTANHATTGPIHAISASPHPLGSAGIC